MSAQDKKNEGYKIWRLAQIWAVGPNLNILCNSIFNIDNKNYSLVRIDLIFVKLLQKTNSLGEFGVVTGVWLNMRKHQIADGNTIFIFFH